MSKYYIIYVGVIKISIINENISIKIKEVRFISWEESAVSVLGRPYHALVFRLSGSAKFTYGDMKSITNAGDVFYMPANHPYHATYVEKNEILAIHFESDITTQMENFHLENPQGISGLFNEIYDIWSKKQYGYYYAALSVMSKILESLALQKAPDQSSATCRAFEKALEYLEKNYTSCTFSIGKTVSEANISHTYFSKLFYRKFNTTPVEYLKSKRLIYAEKLLASGKYSIKEVAELSGFCDVKYFCRVVKKRYGVPPSRLYRHF